MSRESCIKVLQDVFERDMACMGITLTHEALEAVIEYLKDVPSADVPHWIPCSERMPDEDSWAIWCSKKGVQQIARFKTDAIDHFFPSQGFFNLDDAVAWMPLPEPYKDGEQNG